MEYQLWVFRRKLLAWLFLASVTLFAIIVGAELSVWAPTLWVNNEWCCDWARTCWLVRVQGGLLTRWSLEDILICNLLIYNSERALVNDTLGLEQMGYILPLTFSKAFISMKMIAWQISMKTIYLNFTDAWFLSVQLTICWSCFQGSFWVWALPVREGITL